MSFQAGKHPTSAGKVAKPYKKMKIQNILLLLPAGLALFIYFGILLYSSSFVNDSIVPQIPQIRQSHKFQESSRYQQDDTTDAQCSEALYLAWNPDINLLVQQGMYSSGKEHYLQIGWESPELHYFCPRSCQNSTVCVLEGCDKEATYLKSYPEVQRAIKAGSGIVSGLDHFERSGKIEGRSYSCYQRDYGEGFGEDCEEIFSHFMNSTLETVLSWPVVGIQSKLKSETCKAVLIVEGRDDEKLDYILRNNRRYTGPDWMFYLIAPPHIASRWRHRYSGPMVSVIDLPAKFGNLSKYPEEIDSFLRSDFLWRDVIQCEYVLVSQSDAIILRHGLEKYFDYAYVGAPVFRDSFPTIDWRYICTKTTRCGGNGGFSLRRRSYMLLALTNCSIPMHETFEFEDVWYSACLIELGAKLLHPIEANKFSMGSTCQVDNPIGVHKPWETCKASVCVNLIMMSQFFADIYGHNPPSSRNKCREGELQYLSSYPDFRELFDTGAVHSAWEHYQGHKLGRKYQCFAKGKKYIYGTVDVVEQKG